MRAKIWISYFLVVILASCSNTRHLPHGEVLYTGAKINLSGKNLAEKKKKVLKQDLQGLTRPKPNTKILGMRVKLWFYNLGGDTSKKGFIRKFFRKLGEPPVLLSNLNLDKNVAVLNNHLENTGFFRGKLKADTIVRNKRGRAEYKINTGPQYTINEVVFQKDTSLLSQTIDQVISKTLLKKNAPFNLDLIKAERKRIDAHLKENGFYYFSPDYIIVQADTSLGTNKVNLYVNVKQGAPDDAYQIFTINDVYVYPNYSLNTAIVDTNRADSRFYHGYYLVDKSRAFNPRMFEESLRFNTGDIYNRTDHNLSLNRLINLGVFKFVKNRFEEPEGPDSAKLDAYYYLTPFPKKSLRFEVTGTSKSNNMTGSEISLSWRNRSTFKGGELLIVNLTAGSEVQYFGNLQGFNTYRTGIETSLALPKFIVPFRQLDIKGGYVPRTRFMVGYDIVNKSKLYTLTSVKSNIGYIWKEDSRRDHELNPISIIYALPANVTTLYADSAKVNPILRKVIEHQFILGSNYTFTYNPFINSEPIDAIFFRGNADISGNLAGLIIPKNSTTNTKQLFGSDFAQYLKVESDLRFYHQLGLNLISANRIITGFGYPYGNSSELPFIKQFYAGGNNSIRAFRSRSVGPGTFVDTTHSKFRPDESGDIKLELNTELRLKFTKIIEGAYFIDAGNVWLYRKNPEKPGAEFTADFLNQLAIGTGIGLRLNFSFFLIRLDVAFPIRKPYLQDNRWVLNKADFSNSKWRGDNIVYNLAIGYPF